SAVPLLLDGRPLMPTGGESPNPLLRAQRIRIPSVAPEAPASSAEEPADYLYDVETTPGRKLYFLRDPQDE
ncbi:MAG: hypothetical protein K2G10_06055, partial [Alistipes sp.]|nr:hypothetical protein [Alistipes sp.]